MQPFSGFILLVIFLSCDKNSTNRNPYLQEISFHFNINLNLPLYSPLTNIGNAIYINVQGIGIAGVFVIKSGLTEPGQYRVFEASCPNHTPDTCSAMELNGNTVSCSCDNYKYSLFTGQVLNRPNNGNKYYNLLEYRATYSGNIISISN